MFVALGECLTEKSGRVNLGLEGTLVLGAMTGYAISYQTGSPWLGVLAAGCCRFGARRHARLYLQAAARERHRRGHRHDAVRHRRRVLLRQAVYPAVGAAARFVFARRLDRQSGNRDRTADQSAAACRHHRRAGDGLGLRQHQVGPDRPYDRRQRACRARHGRVGRPGPLSLHHCRRLFWRASAARSSRSTTRAPGTRACRRARA